MGIVGLRLKNRFNNVSLALLFAAALGGLFLLGASRVSAADEARGDTWIQISPTKQNLKLDPGSEYEGSFKVQNIGAKGFNYKVYAKPHKVINENFDSNYQDETQRTQISRWITFDKPTGYLESDTETVVTYRVDVPKDVPDGGQYAVIFVETGDGNKADNTISTVKRVGMMIYSRVGGNTREQAEVIENRFDYIQWGAPLKATSVVRNTGNVDVTAEYKLNITDLFGRAVYGSSNEYVILPTDADGRRRVNLEWQDAPALGLFKVKQTVTVFDKANISEHWVLVIHPLVIILIVIFLALVAIYVVYKHKRRQTKKQKTQKHK
ncbi:MAG: hypothetical protein LBL84_00290 [Candidatus Nomurabacteria bacterium]|jgi:hypothetical protein|nr:hypothetical protein [Candidatus Nomurabacteria bacterium]